MALDADDLTLALILRDLLTAGEPRDLVWLLEQQGVPLESGALASSFPGLPSFLGRILSRVVGDASSRSESTRLRSVLDNGRSLQLIRIHPGIPERFSVSEGKETEAEDLVQTIFSRWEDDQRVVTDAEHDALLRHLLAAADGTCTMEELQAQFFAEWSPRPNAGPSVRELQRRHDTVRNERLRLLLESAQRRGWIEAAGGSVGLTREGTEAARALPEDWR
ncbi:MAG: hypothetical protein H6682_11770 [Candidatus Eisenbacteria bacterium]|nr:hypothetical protein [Candidatus Eisenbacteria bacterium]